MLGVSLVPRPPDLASWNVDRIADLPCRVLLPEPYRPDETRYPLVVSLHGSGERGQDNVAQLQNGLSVFERRTHRCIVVAPQLEEGSTFGGSWYGGASEGQQRTMALVRELAARRSVDPARIYAVGFSMGAIGLWDVLVRHPGVFAAAVLIAGDFDAEAAAPLASFPLWAVHGADDELVRPDADRRFAGFVAQHGGIARYTELRGVGHEAWREAFDHAPLWEWLFAQRLAQR